MRAIIPSSPDGLKNVRATLLKRFAIVTTLRKPFVQPLCLLEFFVVLCQNFEQLCTIVYFLLKASNLVQMFFDTFEVILRLESIKTVHCLPVTNHRLNTLIFSSYRKIQMGGI